MSKGNKLEKVQFFVAFAIALLIVLTVSFLFLQVSKQLLTKEMNSPWLAQMLRVVMSIVGLSDLTILKARVPPCSIRHSRAAARTAPRGRAVRVLRCARARGAGWGVRSTGKHGFDNVGATDYSDTIRLRFRLLPSAHRQGVHVQSP